MIGYDLHLGTADGVLVARLEGEIDMANVDPVRAAVVRAVSNEVLGAVLDLSRTAYIDSAGIGLLFHLRERLRVRGQEMRLVVRPGSPAFAALQYAGVLESLAVRDDVDAAVAELRA
jgi:anti-anti-sigma factor